MTQPHDPASARIRNLVVDRLLRMNARHATHAWLQRRSQPVGPHGLAFFYCDTGATHHTVAAATRMVDDTDDVRDLARLLYRLTGLARDRYVAGPNGFDPRICMTNRQDPMSASALYIGIGVSSLDSADATWAELQHHATGPLDLPGRCFALLTDGTQLLIDRGGQDVFGEVRLVSTHDLNVEPGLAVRRWAWRPELTTTPGTAHIWPRMWDLHELVTHYSVPATPTPNPRGPQ